jgi:hypothetical protein
MLVVIGPIKADTSFNALNSKVQTGYCPPEIDVLVRGFSDAALQKLRSDFESTTAPRINDYVASVNISIAKQSAKCSDQATKI